MKIGDRATLTFGPLNGIAGEIIDVQLELNIGGHQMTGKKYKLRWDDPEKGVSEWLSKNDIKSL